VGQAEKPFWYAGLIEKRTDPIAACPGDDSRGKHRQAERVCNAHDIESFASGQSDSETCILDTARLQVRDEVDTVQGSV
jgi:hypothetical protein